MDHSDVKYFKQADPKLEASQIRYDWNADLTVDVVCVLDYEPEERGTRDEPGCLADATLVSAFVRDVDIYALLTSKQIASVEGLAIDAMEARIREVRSERRAARAGVDL
jgi:hypothetical protein